MRHPRLDVGTRIGGRFEIRGLIGGGGMAFVYEARDLEYDRPAAVKVMNAQLARDQRFRERFEREARVANRASHPHILPVWASGEDGGAFFIATPKADWDLGALVDQEGPLEPRRAVDLAGQVAWALDSAHQLGVIHRDVKPGNVLVMVNERAGDHVYLGDFGIAKDVAAPSVTTEYVPFTAAYASPEQIRGERELDGRTDQYSLACTLYDALTGHHPFGETDAGRILRAHLEAPPPRISTARPELPAALDPVLVRAMAKERGERYPDCQSFVAAARAALDPAGVTLVTPPLAAETLIEPPGPTPAGETLLEPPPAARTVLDAPPLPPFAPPPGAPRRRRRPLVAALAGAAGLVVLAVALVLVLGGGDEKEPTRAEAPPPQSTATPEPSPSPTATATAVAATTPAFTARAQRGLRRLIPERRCSAVPYSATVLKQAPEGVRAAWSCRTRLAGQDLVYQRFPGQDTMDAAFDRLVTGGSFGSAEPVTVARCRGFAEAEVGTWSSGRRKRGRLACLRGRPGGGPLYYYVWTGDAADVLGVLTDREGFRRAERSWNRTGPKLQ